MSCLSRFLFLPSLLTAAQNIFLKHKSECTPPLQRSHGRFPFAQDEVQLLGKSVEPVTSWYQPAFPVSFPRALTLHALCFTAQNLLFPSYAYVLVSTVICVSNHLLLFFMWQIPTYLSRSGSCITFPEKSSLLPQATSCYFLCTTIMPSTCLLWAELCPQKIYVPVLNP